MQKPALRLALNLILLTPLAVVPLAVLPGCFWGSGGESASLGLDRTAPVERGLEQGRTLDIQVSRVETRLTMTNTTATTLGPGLMWINQRFARPVDGLGVGESLELKLTEFINQEGEAFRAGGFFSAKDPKRVVLVQYEPTDLDRPTLYGLIVLDDDKIIRN